MVETSNFKLLFLDSGPGRQPVAHVQVEALESRKYGKVAAPRLISAPCQTMVELDAEIRRLHAELDEIRAQARRKFYRAQSAMAGV